MNMIYPTLYKRTTKGQIQVWWLEQDGERYRSHSGKLNGAIVTSGWQVAESKNEGKTNATDPVEQATKEIEATYKKKLKSSYFEKIEDIDEQQYFKPMLAKSFNDELKNLKHDTLVASQPKLDGVRCIATKNGLFTRNGERLVSVPHIEETLKPFFDSEPNMVLDGELYNHLFKEDFNAIISMVKKTKPTEEDLETSRKLVQYHIYDAVLENVHVLQDISDGLATYEHIVLVDTVECTISELDDHYGRYLADGYEGQMVRILNTPYENKRSKYLLKRKEFIDEEFTIIRVEEGNGNRAGMAGNIICLLKDGRTFSASIKGSHEFCKQLLFDYDKYANGTVTVRYQNMTPDGKPRFPVAVAVYEGERTL